MKTEEEGGEDEQSEQYLKDSGSERDDTGTDEDQGTANKSISQNPQTLFYRKDEGGQTVQMKAEDYSKGSASKDQAEE